MYFASKAARDRIRDIEIAANDSASDSQALKRNRYSPLEKKLLFPILAIVWLASKIIIALCKIRRAKQSQTSVVPREPAVRELTDMQKQQANTLDENQHAAQKLREVREAHGADSGAYKAERERIIKVNAGTL